MSDVLITASEVHNYFYCPYAWWYEDVAVEAGRMEMLKAGDEYHRRLATQQPSPAMRRLSRLLVAAAGVLAIAAAALLLLRI